MTLIRFGVASVAKLLGALYGALGLLFGGIFTLMTLVGAGIGAAGGESEAAFGVLFGLGAIVFLPLFYGAIGFVFGAVGAWLYNLVAGFVGGIEVELR